MIVLGIHDIFTECILVAIGGAIQDDTQRTGFDPS